jgi:glyoxylase-like metal-dependent hydrolase (beta-lactamase superfamily II)
VASADPFAPAREAGINRLDIPTPFAVGRVNVYLIEDEPLTLVDAGPNSGTSLDELQRQLGKLGHTIADIGLVVVTHQHIDHIGLVAIVARHAGAEVAGIEALARYVQDYRESASADDEYASEIMLRHGISEDVAQALRSVSMAFRAWGARADITRVLHDGDRIKLRDRSLETHFRPGHSPTDTVFLDSERRLLIAADHLLGHISSNPLISRPIDGGERPQSLVMYLDSLAKTREMEVDLVLTGHGDPVTDHRDLIDRRFAFHERRAERIYRLIAERPRTAYEVAQTLWGNVAVTQAYLALSEVIGHVDILMNAGRVREHEEDGVVRFEAVD